jgi:hypothetical protein
MAKSKEIIYRHKKTGERLRLGGGGGKYDASYPSFNEVHVVIVKNGRTEYAKQDDLIEESVWLEQRKKLKQA